MKSWQEEVLPGFETLFVEEIDNNGNGDDEKYLEYQRKGKLGEMLFDCLCLKMGWQCSLPNEEYLRMDRLVVRGNGIEKVQIKTAWQTEERDKYGDAKKVWIVTVSRGNGNINVSYKDGDFDYLFVPTNGYCWLIPFKDIEGMKRIRVSSAKYNQYRIAEIADIFKGL